MASAGSAGYRVAVLGAGINGLSTAVRLQQIRSDIQVEIIANKFHRETTSCVAAGVFRMHADHQRDGSFERTRRWCLASTQHFYELARSDKSQEAGVTVLPLIHLIRNPNSRKDGPLSHPLYLETALGWRELTETELAHYGRNKYQCGYASTVALCEGEYYLPFLTKMFQQNGGIIKELTLTTLADFLTQNNRQASPYSAVVNCLGLGAREFVPDPSVYAVRGQLDRVKANWMKFCIYGDDDMYVYPCRDLVVIGGVRQRGNESLAVNEADSKLIRERAYETLPALNGAQLVRVDVGLRPCRDGGVRLEMERRGEVTVVHNYAHGGHGVSLSWGCAVDAAQFVSDALVRPAA